MTHTGSEALTENFGPTRRDYYETRELPRQEGVLETTLDDGPSPIPTRKTKQSKEATASKPTSRRGYWEMMSIFRSTNKGSTTRSNTVRTSHSDHP